MRPATIVALVSISPLCAMIFATASSSPLHLFILINRVGENNSTISHTNLDVDPTLNINLMKEP
jgi:hypothetical protein